MNKIKITSQGQAQSRAMDWQHWQSEQAMSIGELSEWHDYWYKVATEFGLVEEFKENAII